jgi:hypothetical protein
VHVLYRKLDAELVLDLPALGHGVEARQPFGSSVAGSLPYAQVVYLLELGRAEDARHLRLAVTSRFGDLLLGNADRGVLALSCTFLLSFRLS